MDPMGYAGLDHNRLTVEITAGIFHGGRYSCIKATTPRHTIKHDPTPAISMMIPHHPKTTSIQIWRIHIYDDLLSNLYRLYSSKMYSKCLSIQIYGNKTCPEVTQMWVWSASSVWVSTPLSWWPTRSRSWERQSFWCNQYQPLLFAPWLWAGYMYIYIITHLYIILYLYIYTYLDSNSHLSLRAKFQFQIVQECGKNPTCYFFETTGHPITQIPTCLELQVDVYSRSFKEESDGKTWFWSSTGPAALLRYSCNK